LECGGKRSATPLWIGIPKGIQSAVKAGALQKRLRHISRVAEIFGNLAMTFKEIVGQLRLAQTQRLISEALQPTKIGSRRLLVICVVVFAVAVGVRLLHWQNNRLTIDNVMFRTAARYKEEAQYLSDRDFASFIRGRSQEPDTGMLIHTPGYPILIALVHAVTGPSNLPLRLIHILGGAAAAVLVLLIALELLPFGAALLTGLFAAISPQLSYYSLVLLPDSIIGLTILAGIYLLARARKRPNQWLIVAAGVCFGLSCWLRANVLLLAPFLCLFVPVLFPREKWLRYSVLLVAAAVLVVMPITIRNTLVFKSFIPLTLGTGTNLIEGIADYDSAKRLGMEQYDHEVAQHEATLYNRPDYAEDLYRSDGVLRERLRVRRAWAVIRANKIWFLGVMARRAGKMLTYEAVSIVSAEPSVSHSLNSSGGELAWSATPEEMLATNLSNMISLAAGGVLRINTTNSVNGLSTKPIKVLPGSDYLLDLPVESLDGRVVVRIVRTDTGKTLASATLPDSLPGGSASEGGKATLQVPFVNVTAGELKLVVANADPDSGGGVIDVGTIQLRRLGPASYLWTRYPRMLVKTLQKFFTTEWMLPLALFGVVLLAVGRRFDALAVTGAVPIYFMITHAPIHLELRYILPIHYFWAMLVATSLYFISISAAHLFARVKRASNPRKVN